MAKYNLPRPITELVGALSAMPGIGPKVANKLAVYLAAKDRYQIASNLQQAVADVLAQVTNCERCNNLSLEAKCSICTDNERDKQMLMVVETPTDLLQVEDSGIFMGSYLVLGGVISPLNAVGPADLAIEKLLKIVEQEQISEIIIALSATVEGEATAIYVRDQIHKVKETIKVTQLAKGLPTGVDIEYLDSRTLSGAVSGRTEFV